MPLVIALAVAVRWLLKYTITKSLLFIGLGYVTYLGIDVVFENAEAAVWMSLDGLPAEAFSYALLCGIDVYISLVFSAFTTGLLVRGISAGTTTMLRWASR